MRPILLDTNAYTAFKRGDESVIAIIQQVEKIIMCPIVIGELLGGFACGSKELQSRKELQQFLHASRVNIISLTSDTANYYSKIYSALKNKGKPIPTNDLWIAAHALENGFAICTDDQHFKAIDGILATNKPEDLLY